MISLFSAACIAALTNGIQLQSELDTALEVDVFTEKFHDLNDYSSFSPTVDEGNAIRASGSKWTDPVFPPSGESLCIDPDRFPEFCKNKWKRLSDIYPAS